MYAKYNLWKEECLKAELIKYQEHLVMVKEKETLIKGEVEAIIAELERRRL